MVIERPSLTAGQLVQALSKLPADTVIHMPDHDSDYDIWYHWAVTGVTETGELSRGTIIDSGSLSDDEDRFFAAGDCECMHDDIEHGWYGCLEDDCTCVAGWEE